MQLSACSCILIKNDKLDGDCPHKNMRLYISKYIYYTAVLKFYCYHFLDHRRPNLARVSVDFIV